MSRSPAARITRVEAPATLVAGERARQLALQGRDIIDLSQSSPYHTTPAHIIEAGIQALRDGLTNVSPSRGLPELRRAMASKLAAHNDLEVDPEGDILVTPGSKKGLFDAINSYIGAGDEVLFLGMDVGEYLGLGTRDSARALLEELGVTYPAGVPLGVDAVRGYSVTSLPMTIFFTSYGEPLTNWPGAINEDQLAEIVERLQDAS